MGVTERRFCALLLKLECWTGLNELVGLADTASLEPTGLFGMDPETLVNLGSIGESVGLINLD